MMRMTTFKVWLTGLLILLSFSLAGPAAAGANVWTSIGPEGGWVEALAINPQTPSTIYMGTNGGGVFKSTNGGGVWNPVNTGWPTVIFLAWRLTPRTQPFSIVGRLAAGHLWLPSYDV